MEWQALLNRLDAKWANYSDFDTSDVRENLVAPADGDAAAEAASGEANAGGAVPPNPKLRLDWEAAAALLAAANASRVVAA